MFRRRRSALLGPTLVLAALAGLAGCDSGPGNHGPIYVHANPDASGHTDAMSRSQLGVDGSANGTDGTTPFGQDGSPGQDGTPFTQDSGPMGPQPDAGTVNPDATTFNPDAMTFNPDATTFNPDATTFNPDATTFNPDATTFNPDATTFNPDATTGTDAGPPGCHADTDCPGGVCLDLASTTGLACQAGETCQCFQSCDPWGTTSGCAPASECYWWDRPSTGGVSSTMLSHGICLNHMGGGTQAQSCTAMFDPNGNTTSDTCDGLSNFLCIGAAPATPMGTCGRLCEIGNDTICGTGGYACHDAFGLAPLGLCTLAQSFNDIGTSCTSGGTCMSGVCSTDLGGVCSAHCAGLTDCPANSGCIIGPNDGNVCAKSCSVDTDCHPPGTVCTDLGSPGSPAMFCIPGCTTSGCTTGTCNMMTGHCG
jgi:hypothetical protein